MKRHNLTKAELIQAEKRRKENLHVWGQMALSLGVLIDCFGFTEEETRTYIEKYDELCKSYLDNGEDIIDMLKRVEKYCGVNLLKGTNLTK